MIVSVVVPTYNGADLIRNSFPYLLKSLNNIDSEVIVVDNGSTDETEKFIKIHYPDIKILKLRKNYGFTRAVNEGTKIARGTYILILNNDCFLEKDTVVKLLKTTRKSVYVATQPVVYTKQKQNIENIGYVVDTWVGKAKPVRDKKKKFNSTSSRYIYGLSATCLLIRKDIFIKIGMFDETFHSYLEDIDLFIRLHNANYKYYPSISASCTHAHMSTSSKMGTYKEIKNFQNWIRIIIKNYEPVFILKHFPTLFIERLRNLNGIIKKMII